MVGIWSRWWSGSCRRLMPSDVLQRWNQRWGWAGKEGAQGFSQSQMTLSAHHPVLQTTLHKLSSICCFASIPTPISPVRGFLSLLNSRSALQAHRHFTSSPWCGYNLWSCSPSQEHTPGLSQPQPFRSPFLDPTWNAHCSTPFCPVDHSEPLSGVLPSLPKEILLTL